MDKLKSEIFDIIRQQDVLKLQYAQLEKAKETKLQELQTKEKENAVQTKPAGKASKS